MIRSFRSVAPTVDPSAFVDASAQVIGDVQIGAECSIWMGAVLRGDIHAIRIGARTNIQDLSCVHVMRGTHPATIGSNVTIGHGVNVHGATIEDRCLIGIGAILLNGSVIGTGSIVAAGALVTEGTIIPPGSLVMGSPGKVRRPLSPEEDASIMRYADNYVRYRLDYIREAGSGIRDPRDPAAAGSRIPDPGSR